MSDGPAIYPIDCHGYFYNNEMHVADNHREVRLVTKRQRTQIQLCKACEIEFAIIEKYSAKLGIIDPNVDIIKNIRAISTKALEHPSLFSDEEIEYLKQFALEKEEE